MSVKVDGEAETTTIEHLDFEHEPPCELEKVASEECSHAAEWKVVIGCCAETFLFCEDHFLEIMEYFRVNKNEFLQHNMDFGGCGGWLSIAHYEKFKVSA